MGTNDAGVYRLYAFALNMLIRRYASIADDLCGASIDAMKAACAAAPAIYPPVKMASTGVIATNARPKESDLVAMKTGFRAYVPNAEDGSYFLPGAGPMQLKMFAPPAEMIGLMAYTVPEAQKIVREERDVDLEEHAISEVLGNFNKDLDPTIAVVSPCELMMSKVLQRSAGRMLYDEELNDESSTGPLEGFSVKHSGRGLADGSGMGDECDQGLDNPRECHEKKRMHVVSKVTSKYASKSCLGLLTSSNADIDAVQQMVGAQAEYLEIYRRSVCDLQKMDPVKCALEFETALGNFEDSQQQPGGAPQPGKLPEGGLQVRPPSHQEEPAENFDVSGSVSSFKNFLAFSLRRRLEDVADAALPSLRSATASALPRDGTSARVGARRLSKGSGAADHVDKYKEMVEEYSDCLAAIETSKCATNLALMSTDDAKVQSFYSKTGLVMAACAGIVTPSDCPVDMFSKEVSFMWGNGGVKSTYTKSKTSSYIAKGLPAASRIDKFVNFFTELF